MRKKAFTLIELLIVIVIIGVLAAAMSPQFTGFILRAKLKEVENTIPLILAGEKYYFFKTGSYYEWKNWSENNYAGAEAALNITIPKPLGAICKYRVWSNYGAWPYRIDFMQAKSPFSYLGSYALPNGPYTIETGTGEYYLYLKYLER